MKGGGEGVRGRGVDSGRWERTKSGFKVRT